LHYASGNVASAFERAITMTTLVATGFPRSLEQVLAAFAAFIASFMSAASRETTEIVPAHLSARAKRLMRADY
jgi:hypothetical protein